MKSRIMLGLAAALAAEGHQVKMYRPRKRRPRKPHTRKGEAERRRRQIEKGTLRVENGLRLKEGGR